MKLFVFAVFALGVVNALSIPPQCEVGEWSDWGECKSEKRCVKEAEKSDALKTYHLAATDAWDAGRVAMQYNMLVKETWSAERAACVARGNCPSTLADRPSSGAAFCVNGLAGDLPCNNVDLLSFVNFADMGYVPIPSDKTPAGNDVWGWEDPLNGDEYAIMCLTGATTFVRVTDPANPVPVGIIYSATTATTWRDAKVIGNYVYIVSEARDHGLQVFDLTRLRGLISVKVFLPDATERGFGNAHNIVSNEETNFVYIVGATQTTYPQVCKGGLYVVDVSDPLNPTYAGCFGGDGYVHDAQCVNYHGPDTNYHGKEICFCFNEDTFTIVDVTDKKNMYMISKTGYSGYAYTHQGWLTEDHTIVLMDDELDEKNRPSKQQFTKTYVWDIVSLKEPQLKNVFESPERSIDHNQYIIKDLVFQANYEAGLRILHLDQESFTLTQVGYLDVLPSRTTANFAGTWSVFPYYKSGLVAVSSIDYGLFIARPKFDAIRKQIEEKAVIAEKVRTREVLHREGGWACPPLQESTPCSAEVTC